MRNLAVTLILILAAIVAVPVMPQTTMGIPPEVMKRLSVSYDLNTLYPKDLDGVSFSGFGVGYSMDFPVSDTRPLYIGTGVDFRFIFRAKTYSQTEQYNLVNIKQRTSFIQMNIPANIGYILPAGAGVSVTPYAGVTFRVQLYGHNRNRIFHVNRLTRILTRFWRKWNSDPPTAIFFLRKITGRPVCAACSWAGR